METINGDIREEMGCAAVAHGVENSSGGGDGARNNKSVDSTANDDGRDVDDLTNNDEADCHASDSDDESLAETVDSNGLRVRFREGAYLDKEVLEELKLNARDIKSVSVRDDYGGCSPLDIEWEKEVNSLSENTHLTTLSINYQRISEFSSEKEKRDADRNAKNFYRFLSSSRSLTHLTIDGTLVHGLDMGDPNLSE